MKSSFPTNTVHYVVLFTRAGTVRLYSVHAADRSGVVKLLPDDVQDWINNDYTARYQIIRVSEMSDGMVGAV